MAYYTLTVKDLAILCFEEYKKGNGGKKIMLSDDEEGNGYHNLFFGFKPVSEEILAYTSLHDCTKEEALKDYIILG